MSSFLLRLSSRKESDGRQQVIVKFTVSRQVRPCFKSGVYVQSEWFTASGLIIPRKGKYNHFEVKEAETAQDRLNVFKNRLTKICRALEEGKEELSSKSITDALLLTNSMNIEDISINAIIEARKKSDKLTIEAPKSFYGWMERYIIEKQPSYDQIKGFRVLMRALARYEAFVNLTDRKRKGFKLDIDKIDKETILDFFDYFSNEKELSEEYPKIFDGLLAEYPADIKTIRKSPHLVERGENTVRKLKKKLKAFFNWLYKCGYSTNQPFNGIEIKSETYGTPYYLTIEERNQIADTDLSYNRRLEIQRDIFIFQCLIGCRVGDLLRMTISNLNDDEQMIEYIANKTKGKDPKTVSVPLNSRSKALVEKYKGVDGDGRLFPFISAQKYNEAIKEVLTRCGVTRMVTILNPTTGKEEQRPINEIASSHMARRTFIGNLYKKVKDPNLICHLSGHEENSKAFARYRKIDDDIKREMVELID